MRLSDGIGSGKTSAENAIREAEAAWFLAHPGRKYRARIAQISEVLLGLQLNPGFVPEPDAVMVIISQWRGDGRQHRKGIWLMSYALKLPWEKADDEICADMYRGGLTSNYKGNAGHSFIPFNPETGECAPSTTPSQKWMVTQMVKILPMDDPLWSTSSDEIHYEDGLVSR